MTARSETLSLGTKIIDGVDTVTDKFGRFLAITPLLLILVQFIIVAMISLFDTGSIKLQESLQYINALMFLGGAGYTLKQNDHVRVDLFYSKLSKRKQDWIDLFGCLFLLLPFVGLVWWAGLPYVIASWENGDKSVEASGLAYVYILKSTILLYAMTLSMQGITMTLRIIGRLKGTDKDLQGDAS